MTPREVVLRQLAEAIVRLRSDQPTRVAIDGVTGAGKTKLADELAAVLADQGIVQRISVDDFHAPEEERYRRGNESPEGYYLDTFDYPRFRDAIQELMAASSIVIADGVFLFRPELNDLWDYRIFVSVDLEVAYQRATERDTGRPWVKRRDWLRHRYEVRYIPGERIYLEKVDPIRLADAVFENTNPLAPQLRLP